MFEDQIKTAQTTIKMLRNRSIQRVVAAMNQEFPSIQWYINGQTIDGEVRIHLTPGGSLVEEPDVDVDTFGYSKTAVRINKQFKDGEYTYRVKVYVMHIQAFDDEEKAVLTAIGKLRRVEYGYLALTC